MATVQPTTLVRHIRKLAAGGSVQQWTDRQLLDDFAARRNEAAFTALVSRHGPMVLRVCRRVLHHEQDAEDAFQATFLVLVGNAGSIRKRDAVADWLHGVAYRTAMKTKRSAARRRNHEARLRAFAPQAAASPSWDDVQAVLDEEVQRLPRCFREAFVLCVLQGKGGPEAAAELGCKEGTVKSRVNRARRQLRRQLGRRGIDLTALLAALSVAESTSRAAVSALLVHATIRSGLLVAAGEPAAAVIPAHVARVATGVTRAMFLTKFKIATALLLAACLLAAAGVLTHQVLGARETEPPVQAQPKAEASRAKSAADDPLSLTGRVLDPDGKPVAGARLYLPHWLKERPESPDEVVVTQRGTTDKDGRFRLNLPRKEAQPGRAVPLIATAEGFGLAWTDLPTQEPPGELTLRLVKDLPIRGRVVTTEGKPVAGVKVAVRGVMAFERLDDFVRAYQREMRHADEGTGTRQLALPLAKVLRVTQSDKDGRFEITGVGAERVAGIELKSAALAQEMMVVVTRAGFDAKAIAKDRPSRRGGGRAALLFGPTFEHVVEPARFIEGTVREAGTGTPVAGASLRVLGVSAVSDAQGHYRLIGMRKAPEYTVEVVPPASAPLIGRWVQVSGAPGLEPIRTDVELEQGVVVTGRVLDKATGKGVESQVRFAPLPANPFARKGRNLALYAWAHPADGRFRLVTIPGPGVLLAQVTGTALKIDGMPIYPYKPAEFDAADRRRVKLIDDLKPFRAFLAAGGPETLDLANACKVVNLKEGGDAVSCDLLVDPGKTLTVSLQDPEGKPLAGALAAGVSAQALRALPLKSAVCPVFALDPEKPRQLVFLHEGRKLAAQVTLRGDEKEPVTVRLAPTGVVTGRALDVDGQPVAGAEVHVLYPTDVGRQLTKMTSRWSLSPRTDKEGCFRLEGIVPGLKVDLGFVKGRQVLVPATRLEAKPLEAGKALDLGEVRLKPRRE